MTDLLDNNRLHIVYPELPPTENKIREIRWGRIKGKARPLGMTYTTEADHYRKKFREFIRTTLFVEVQKFRKKHTTSKTYTLTLLFFFRPEDILNQGWLKNKAKTPYKKMDVGNRRKLLEDCFAESLDIDDSLFFGVELYKFVGDEAKVELILEETDPRTFGIPNTYSGRVL